MSELYKGEMTTDVSNLKIWKLVLYVSPVGFKASYYNTATQEVVEVLKIDWNCNEQEMLHRLQDVVYEHSILLTEHSTIIVVESKHYVVAPSRIIKTDDDAERLIESLHTLKDDDMWIDRVDDKSIIFSSAEGLDSFLQRTFIVERIISHLNPFVRCIAQLQSTGQEKMIVALRRNRLDVVAERKGLLLLANTFEWQEVTDASYYLLNAWQTLGLDQQSAELHLYGDKDLRDSVSVTLRKFINYVIPQNVSVEKLIVTSIF